MEKAIAVFIVVFILLTIMINNFGKDQVSKACYVFSQNSGFETKFVEYTFWHRDCLAKLDDGKWISAYNLNAGFEK